MKAVAGLTSLVLVATLTACASSDSVTFRDLKPGDCVRGTPELQDLQQIDCAEAESTSERLAEGNFEEGSDLEVIWIQEISGDEYPGDAFQLQSQCDRIPLTPSQEAWDDGDRFVICFKSAYRGG